MRNRTNSARGASIILAAMLLAGCKAAPAPSAGFADPTVMKSDPAIPFNRFWRKPDVNWKQYDTIFIADVNTSYMLKMTDWQKGERQADIGKDVHDLALYTRNDIIKAFRDDPRHRFKVIDKPTNDSHTLILQMALIEVVPSKVLLNALGYAPFYIGTGITTVRTLTSDKSSAAFELRVRDAETGQTVMQAADREAEQFAIIDLRGLTWYSDVQGIIDEWSLQFVQIANKQPNQTIAGSSTFRLLPW